MDPQTIRREVVLPAQEVCSKAKTLLKLTLLPYFPPLDVRDIVVLIETIDSVSGAMDILSHFLDTGGINFQHPKSPSRGPGAGGHPDKVTIGSAMEWCIRTNLLKFYLDDGAELETAIDTIANYSIKSCIDILKENGFYED